MGLYHRPITFFDLFGDMDLLTMFKNTKKIEYILLTAIFSLIILGIILAKVNNEYYKDVYTIEDGFIEWLTFAILAFGSITCFFRAVKIRAQKGGFFLLALIGLGLVFLFGAGEEISWGQRIFGTETTGFFKQFNAQQETNFHNLKFNGIKINKLVFGKILTVVIIFYLAVLPILDRKYNFIADLIKKFAVPLPKTLYIASYVFLFILLLSLPTKERGEMLEFGGAAIFLCIIYFPANENIFQLNDELKTK